MTGYWVCAVRFWGGALEARVVRLRAGKGEWDMGYGVWKGTENETFLVPGEILQTQNAQRITHPEASSHFRFPISNFLFPEK
jgi:hypothetical protein